MERDAKVARGVAALYLANLTTLLLNTLFLVLLANYYGSNQAEVGLVSFLNVVLVSASTLAVLALPIVGSGVIATPPAVARFLRRGVSGGAPGARRVYLLSLALCGVISVSIAALAAYPPVADLVAGRAESGAVFYACLDAVVYSFAQLGAYTMLGTDRATSAGTVIMVSSGLRYLFASALLLAGAGPSGVFIGFAAGDALLAVAANAVSARALGSAPGGPAPMGHVLRYMVSVFFAALMGLAVSQTDKLLAFFQLGLGNLAVYNIATVGAAVASFAPAAATNVLVPALSSITGDEGRKRDLLRVYSRHISLSAIPIGFCLAAVSPFLLRVFGDVYVSGAPVLALIAISISLTAVAAVYSSSLLVEDRAHHFTLSNLLGLAGLVAVSVAAAPTLGFLGIALGRAAMLFIMLAAVVYFARRGGALVIDAGAYVRSLAASAAMAALVFAALHFWELLGAGRLALVAGSVAMVPLGLCFYLLAMKALRAYTVEDMDFIDSLLPRSMRRLSRLARRLL